MAKKVAIKSFRSGTFIKTIDDADFGSFVKNINGGLSELTLKLARKIDNFNTDLDVSLGNKIEIWVTDDDTDIDGERIYSGYIEEQMPYLSGGNEYVEIKCIGIVAKLENDILKDSDQTTLYTNSTDGLTATSGSQDAAEVADVIKAIIDKYTANNTDAEIVYNTSGTGSIGDTDKTIDYTFEAMKYIDAIEKCRQVAPENWYWYIDENNLFTFAAKPSSPTHTFDLGKHISRITVNKSIADIKNVVLIWDGQAAGTYKSYDNDTSLGLYGRRVEQINDSKIADEDTMDNIGAAFIAENKDPRIMIEIEVIDNNESDFGYDIESIKPGDTCKIVGINDDGSIFTDNMLIKQVEWKLTKATVIIETRKDFDLSRYIIKTKRELDEEKKSGIPESYT